MKETELNKLQRLRLEALWLGARMFASLPYWFKFYVVENLLFVLFYYLLRYRMKVVKENLQNSFPEKSESERAVICRKFYRTLAEVFVCTFNIANMSTRKVRRMITIKNLEELVQQVHGHDWIAMTAHYGSWEYCSLWGHFERSQAVVAVYHPLRSAVAECFYQRLRNNENSRTVSMKESLRFYLRNHEKGIDGKNLVMGLIADQNPPRRPNSHWFQFLNQDTIFFDGGEKLALRYSLPVYFMKSRRVRPGCYEMSLEQIYDGKEEVAEYEITERYVCKLESMIRETPELWLWSHRRWKHKRTHDNS